MRRFETLFLIPFLLTLLSPGSAFAINARVLRQDVKPATQSMLEHRSIDNAIVASTNYIKASFAGATAATAISYTTFNNQPDVPRALTITPGSTTSAVEACTITVTGTNIFGATITEDFVFADNASTATVGTKAFKTVSSVAFPADCEAGSFDASWIVGVADVLGLHRCMDNAGDVGWVVFDGSYEATRPTVVAHASHVHSNTIDINGTLNGAKDIDAYFVQNWRCLP